MAPLSSLTMPTLAWVPAAPKPDPAPPARASLSLKDEEEAIGAAERTDEEETEEMRVSLPPAPPYVLALPERGAEWEKEMRDEVIGSPMLLL